MPNQHEQHPVEMVLKCSYTVALLAELISQDGPPRGLNLSEEGVEGLHGLLREIESTLDSLMDVLPDKPVPQGGK